MYSNKLFLSDTLLCVVNLSLKKRVSVGTSLLGGMVKYLNKGRPKDQ